MKRNIVILGTPNILRISKMFCLDLVDEVAAQESR